MKSPASDLVGLFRSLGLVASAGMLAARLA